jgi:hypothetical protein
MSLDGPISLRCLGVVGVAPCAGQEETNQSIPYNTELNKARTLTTIAQIQRFFKKQYLQFYFRTVFSTKLSTAVKVIKTSRLHALLFPVPATTQYPQLAWKTIL